MDDAELPRVARRALPHLRLASWRVIEDARNAAMADRATDAFFFLQNSQRTARSPFCGGCRPGRYR
jgi:hypothetical protein